MSDVMEVDDPRRPESIWLKGVDNLSTGDVKKYAKKFTEEFFKVEWINDSTLNLVFEEESHARDALNALTKDKEQSFEDLTERAAEDYDTSNPDVSFLIRMTRLDDKKVKNAAAYSRYYLFNPKEERRDKRRADGGYRDRESRRSRRRSTTGSDDELFPEKVSSSRGVNVTTVGDSDDLIGRPDLDAEDLLSGGPAPSTEAITDTQGSDDILERIAKDSQTDELFQPKGSLFDRIGSPKNN